MQIGLFDFDAVFVVAAVGVHVEILINAIGVIGRPSTEQ